MPRPSDQDDLNDDAASRLVEYRPQAPQRDRRRRHLPPMSVLPTLCTLGNLVAGFAAVHFAAKPAEYVGPWGWTALTFAGVLIFLGMTLDAIDGWVARLMRSTSELGSQLDSLADVVTFGVAPAFMMVQLVGRQLSHDSPTIIIGPDADDALGKVVWAVAVVYICCGALRLARFNVETGPGGLESRKSFRGLPSPGAAGTIASLILLQQHLVAGRFAGEVPDTFARGVALGIPFITLLCGLAMVSSTPYVHVSNRYLFGNRSFRYVVRLVVVLALVIWFPQEMLSLLFLTYIVAGPAQLAWKKIKKGSGVGGQGSGEEEEE